MRGYVGIVAMLQHQPESSLATATATSVERLPRWVSRRCQRWWSRVWQRSARSMICGSSPSRRVISCRLRRSGLRCCQAASTSSRLAWPLPVFVICPRLVFSPLEDSLGTSPRNAPIVAPLNLCQSPI